MDPLDAILASMAQKTGNVLKKPVAEKQVKAPSDAKDTAVAKRKREEQDADESTGQGIWNPTAFQQLPDALLHKVADRAAKMTVTPPKEIARQQIVRQLCQKIRRASEQMGINKLPNSTYETWQFTSRLTVAEVDPLIPHASSDYSGLFEELIKAGATRTGAKKKCQELTKEAEKQLRRFSQQNFDSGKKKARVTQESDMMVLTYGQTSVKVGLQHYEKLRLLYKRRNQVELTKPQDQRAFEAAVFSLLLRYDTLDGGGFQAALNEECFDTLLRHFDCKMECFASPLNSRYSRFCSAFLDTDAAFGSVGSFFDFTPRTGCFEANPPFIPQLIKRMADHMSALLDAADGALMFIIIIPAWKETEGWKLLHASRYNQQDMIVAQKDHGYCEGKQQIRKTRWRIASFDTSVFFWQNAKATQKWPVTKAAMDDLREAFRSKQAEERETLGLRNSGKRVRAM
ncbi:hypothetical protein Poli38472_000461 [Pythium oligandrum]|uniref:PCIF1 WW domain-containing protein n=1 Tax=Pythium oligandrum TaxID=41045 RepID=A0A8K1FGW1_PYTOL|nr:hypothetical protein Poli38472_000461 [Pythium oligandrum]|eukprot:TMW60419.1 hypothetical protein Poli38472_000461 [Pythium oligandrum]